MVSKYAQHVSRVSTSQSEPLPGQVKNSAGGHSWEVDCWTRMDRFLILGAEGGTYYVDERKLTKEAAASVLECHKLDPKRTIDRIIQVSVEGLAHKNDPAIFALALLSHDPASWRGINEVCRIGTHLFQYVQAAKEIRGNLGSGLRKVIWRWYSFKTDDQIAYQVTKYQQRDGMSHADVIRLIRPKHRNTKLMRKILGQDGGERLVSRKNSPQQAYYPPATGELPSLFGAIEDVKIAAAGKNWPRVAELISRHRLAREVLPTEALNQPVVWEAMLENMPLTAMIRNLGKMSAIGVLNPLSSAAIKVAEQIDNEENLKRARVHPMTVLLALATYKQGRGVKGSLSWNPCREVNDALESAFYKAFKAVEPTNKRHLLALDVSGSMSSKVSGTHLSAAQCEAAMALVTVRTEPRTHTVCFTSNGGWYSSTSLTEMDFGRHKGLNEAMADCQRRNFGATDCALPMIYAMEKELEVDAFVVYTDSETWAGRIHPTEALRQYRKRSGINAKLICVAMVPNRFSVADPNDAGMLDVLGFDASVPQVMSQFIGG